MSDLMQVKMFDQINLSDPFFDSLKADYPGFESWFERKAKETAYVMYDDKEGVEGFLYLKTEVGSVNDVTPPLPDANRLKVGTFKIEAHGTKLGERFFKKIFDEAVAQEKDEIYVTIFSKHEALVRLFDRYGFTVRARKRAESGDEELVMVRDLDYFSGDPVMDYPFIHSKGHSKYLLAIHPQWHTQLLPDSILRTESFDIVKDLSHTNSVHKIYVCWMAIGALKPGDILVIYRTNQGEPGPAEYKAVATSICVVEDVRRGASFSSVEEFLKYCGPYSVFTKEELTEYAAKNGTWVIKFTYNAAMSKKLIRQKLADEIGLNRNDRWGFIPLSDKQFAQILKSGGVNENLIVD